MRDSRSRGVLLALLAAGLVGSVLPVAASAERATTKGVFNVNCFFSHRAADDPIVFPRQPGATHSHDFAGNVGTDAFSTPRSLRGGATNCEHYAPGTGRRGDQAGYWFPTLYVHGVPVTPRRVTAYYQSGDRNTSKIRPFPARLKMITGDARGVVDYRRKGANIVCASTEGTVVEGTRTVAPTCAAGTPLVGRVRFPDCWDGRRSDSRNHKRHMAYSKFAGNTVGLVCPRSHPVLVPQLILENIYDTTAGPTTRLASGDISTWHADFMNGWKMRKQIQLVTDCLVPDLYCGGRDRPANPPRKRRVPIAANTRPAASLSGHIRPLLCRL
jgi:Domain of unknown function (DUF1996)